MMKCDLVGKNFTHTFMTLQAKLELVQLSDPVDHAEAFGRIAFSCPTSEVFPLNQNIITYLTFAIIYIHQQLPEIERSMKEAEQTLLTPLLSLDTPGKATVQVVILADPVSSYYLKVTIIYRYYSTFFYDFGLNDVYDIVLKFVIFTRKWYRVDKIWCSMLSYQHNIMQNFAILGQSTKSIIPAKK